MCKEVSDGREARYGSFSRSLAIPERVDDERIATSYNGEMPRARVPSPAGETSKARGQRVSRVLGTR